MNKNVDKLLFDSLKPAEEPSAELNRQILKRWSKEDQTMKKNYMRKGVVAAACACVLATGSVSAYAAYHYLNPVQIAENVSNDLLREAFSSDDAIVINEAQESNGYRISLLGLVTGEGLDPYVPEEKKSELNKKETYAAFAIERVDGTRRIENSLCISALISGVSFKDFNNGLTNASLTWFEKDGIVYELYNCNDLEQFADRGVYLGVVDSFGSESSAFEINEENGRYVKVDEYTGTNALFQLPFAKEAGDYEQAEKYLRSLKQEPEKSQDENELEQELQSKGDLQDELLQKLVDTITVENLEDYFTEEPDFKVTAMPDANGWVDFGSKYVEDEYGGYTVNGGQGIETYWIDKGQNFKVTGFDVGGNEQIDLSTLEIYVTIRNEDGSLTNSKYLIKNDDSSFGEILKRIGNWNFINKNEKIRISDYLFNE